MYSQKDFFWFDSKRLDSNIPLKISSVTSEDETFRNSPNEEYPQVSVTGSPENVTGRTSNGWVSDGFRGSSLVRYRTSITLPFFLYKSTIDLVDGFKKWLMFVYFRLKEDSEQRTFLFIWRTISSIIRKGRRPSGPIENRSRTSERRRAFGSFVWTETTSSYPGNRSEKHSILRSRPVFPTN